VKVARTVLTGGLGKRTLGQRALILPTAFSTVWGRHFQALERQRLAGLQAAGSSRPAAARGGRANTTGTRRDFLACSIASNAGEGGVRT
jgi:hypothetical protein